jgi:hypothetical protein
MGRGDACVARGPQGHKSATRCLLSAYGRPGDAGVAPTTCVGDGPTGPWNRQSRRST